MIFFFTLHARIHSSDRLFPWFCSVSTVRKLSVSTDIGEILSASLSRVIASHADQLSRDVTPRRRHVGRSAKAGSEKNLKENSRFVFHYLYLSSFLLIL